MTTTESAVASHTYTIYIDATPEAIWNAITDGEQTVRYGYGCPVEYELRPAAVPSPRSPSEAMGEHMPDVIIEGEVIEADAPHTLVQTWNPLFGPPITDEPSTRLTYAITPAGNGVDEGDDDPRARRRARDRRRSSTASARDGRRLGVRPQRPQELLETGKLVRGLVSGPSLCVPGGKPVA